MELREVLEDLKNLNQEVNEVAEAKANRVAKTRQSMAHLREQLQDEMERE